MKRTLKRYRLVLLVLAATVAGGFIASGASQKRSPLQQYMRQKLEHAQYALEGLALEDFKLIEKNATAMRKLSEDGGGGSHRISTTSGVVRSFRTWLPNWRPKRRQGTSKGPH